jgi:hypothetical protein
MTAPRGSIRDCDGEADVEAQQLAAAAFEALLTDQLRVLSPNHPDTLSFVDAIMNWGGGTGRGQSRSVRLELSNL